MPIEGLSFADVRPRAPGNVLHRWAAVAVDHVRTRAGWGDSRIGATAGLGPQRNGTGGQQQKRQRASTDARRLGWPHDAGLSPPSRGDDDESLNAISAAALIAVPIRTLAGS